MDELLFRRKLRALVSLGWREKEAEGYIKTMERLCGWEKAASAAKKGFWAVSPAAPPETIIAKCEDGSDPLGGMVYGKWTRRTPRERQKSPELFSMKPCFLLMHNHEAIGSTTFLALRSYKKPGDFVLAYPTKEYAMLVATALWTGKGVRETKRMDGGRKNKIALKEAK